MTKDAAATCAAGGSGWTFSSEKQRTDDDAKACASRPAACAPIAWAITIQGDAAPFLFVQQEPPPAYNKPPMKVIPLYSKPPITDEEREALEAGIDALDVAYP